MRFMLDECMTKRASYLLVEALKLHKPPIESYFLEDHFGAKGLHDGDWTKELEKEGGWSVITCDMGRIRGEKAKLKGPPLHLILPFRKITGFFLSGRMASRSGFEKARSVLYLFPQIHEMANTAVAGTRFKIVAHQLGYRMDIWPIKAALPDLPTEPWQLSPQ